MCMCGMGYFFIPHKAGTDYMDVPEELSFPANTPPASSTQCFRLFTIDNSIVDGDRNLSILVTSFNERVMSDPAQIIIVDDECK